MTITPDDLRALADGLANQNAEAERVAARYAASADMLDALRLHKAWADSEDRGPDYGGQTRDTHPDGERIWREWWEANLLLCDRAQRATDAAIAKAERPQP